eukprot:Cvel_14291.t2-p1 / transcript=Cvel_14291.t2 / gene=Cvel_14291 / organism=Chromera_velia_CCMP2878 / gene_product=hypothetical protein / transcript_product=hypothetical protein / location=Cvel_scaffold1009:45596-46375(-) / protein_length=260 / sequence_SO=supercontig / SO=protein_coding / is_pseudo=false
MPGFAIWLAQAPSAHRRALRTMVNRSAAPSDFAEEFTIPVQRLRRKSEDVWKRITGERRHSVVTGAQGAFPSRRRMSYERAFTHSVAGVEEFQLKSIQGSEGEGEEEEDDEIEDEEEMQERSPLTGGGSPRRRPMGFFNTRTPRMEDSVYVSSEMDHTGGFGFQRGDERGSAEGGGRSQEAGGAFADVKEPRIGGGDEPLDLDDDFDEEGANGGRSVSSRGGRGQERGGKGEIVLSMDEHGEGMGGSLEDLAVVDDEETG